LLKNVYGTSEGKNNFRVEVNQTTVVGNLFWYRHRSSGSTGTKYAPPSRLMMANLQMYRFYAHKWFLKISANTPSRTRYRTVELIGGDKRG
jgi:hypothetical protein